MKKKLLSMILAATMVMGMSVPVAAEEAGETFKLGSLMTTAGALALLCDCESKGIHMAVDAINEKGGLEIDGKQYPVELIEYDVGTDPNTQIDYTQRLITSDGVCVINGLMDSGKMKNELEVTTPAKTIVYNSVGSPAVLVTSPYGVNLSDTAVLECHSLMELWGEDDATLEAAGLPVEKIRSKKRVAVFGMNEAYTELAALGLQDGCEKYGLEFAGSVMFQPDTTDFLPYVQALKDLNPDVIMLNTYSNDTMIPPLRDMLQLGLDFTSDDVLLLGNDVMASGAFIAAAAEQGVDVNGAIAFAKYPNELPEAYAAWEEEAKAYLNNSDYDSLLNYVSDGYDSTMFMFNAIEKAGTLTDTDKIMEVVNSETYTGLLGDMKVSDGQMAQIEHIKYLVDGEAVDTGIEYSDVLTYGNAIGYPLG